MAENLHNRDDSDSSTRFDENASSSFIDTTHVPPAIRSSFRANEREDEDDEHTEGIVTLYCDPPDLVDITSTVNQRLPYTEPDLTDTSSSSGSSLQVAETSSPRTSPVDAKDTFGSNENVYNPYLPLESNDYIDQEINAGRMGTLGTKTKTYISHEPKNTSTGDRWSINRRVGTPESTEKEIIDLISATFTAPQLSKTRLPNDPVAQTDGHHAHHIASQAQMPNSTPRSTIQQPSHGLHSRTSSSAFERLAGLGAGTMDRRATDFLAMDNASLVRLLETRVLESLAISDSSLNSPLEPLTPQPPSSTGTPSSLQLDASPRRRTLTEMTSPRRRTGIVRALRGIRTSRGMSSASIQADATLLADSSANEGESALIRKRRRTDEPDSEARMMLSNPQGAATLLGERQSTALAYSISSESRSRRSFNAGPGVDRSLQHRNTDFLRKFSQLPQDLRSKIMEHVLDFTPSVNTPLDRFMPPMNPQWKAHCLYVSELIPRTFSVQKRQRIIYIFREKAPYVPAAIAVPIAMYPSFPPVQLHITNGNFYYRNLTRSRSSYPLRSGRRGRGWPANILPTEVFDNIVSTLSRDDLAQMRLVNHEFEKKVSNTLFRRVVVPFRPEIYGFIVKRDLPMEVSDIEGKGKAKELPFEEDTTGKDVHDGMKVFEAWGPHINQFAMAFEIDENELTNPPPKEKEEVFTTFWGRYKWPHPYYNRYEICALLEKKADEYRCMSMALSHLTKAKTLGLSIESGLGWLVGPDISDRAQLFKDKPPVFGEQLVTNCVQDERKEAWTGITRTLGAETSEYGLPRGFMVAPGSEFLIRNAYGFYEVHLYDAAAQSSHRGAYDMEEMSFHFMDKPRYRSAQPAAVRPLVFQGVDLADGGGQASRNIVTADSQPAHHYPSFSKASLKPNELTAPQKELLLETEWAQRAFLSSYCMALCDNTEVFQHITTLNIARLSSRYIQSLQRSDFWQALPQMNSLTCHISPDFRDIQKIDTGEVKALDIRPSEAASAFYLLLLKYISDVPSIKIMDIGYCGGGEHQVGIFGRNQNVLPAPLTNMRQTIDNGGHAASLARRGIIMEDAEEIVALPNVEHLTLTNCWIAPPTLKNFVLKLCAPNMQTLTLDSVSLTAHVGLGVDVNEPNPLDQSTFSRLPDGPPRLFDSILGNLHQQRSSATHPDPDESGCWINHGGRIGSWRNVIDTITPGPTIDLLRWVYRHTDDFPVAPKVGSLKQVIFKSCGYARLVHDPSRIDQDALGEIVKTPPPCLQQRAQALAPFMMRRPSDNLLGQIVPSIPEEEHEVFRSAFPMELGWEDREAAENVLEDGQPRGGSGRFSGRVERLIYPDQADS